jgi:hypothetical protein
VQYDQEADRLARRKLVALANVGALDGPRREDFDAVKKTS